MDEVPESLSEPVREGLKFDRGHWATGSVASNAFYSVSADSADALPGTLLKVERDVKPQDFSLPISTALSRLIYQSQSLNGKSVPVSAYVLWPFAPRCLEDGFQVVAWSHGTSGVTPEAAPSHMKNLWQHFMGPYQLALQGYVVVATDYAGLGVGKDASGKLIRHEYLATSSQANDVIYSVIAARAAFPELSQGFVVVGHSQGGGSAWACARRQTTEPVDGYLGAVALSPVTGFLDEPEPLRSILTAAAIPGIEQCYTEFSRAAVMTEEGMLRLGELQVAEPSTAPALVLLTSANPLFKPGYDENSHIRAYHERNVNTGKEISGPMFIAHGEIDPLISFGVTSKAVEATAAAYPTAQMKFVRIPGVTHNASLSATQHLWTDWIAARFAGKEQETGLRRTELKMARQITSYNPELNWFVEAATEYYQTP